MSTVDIYEETIHLAVIVSVAEEPLAINAYDWSTAKVSVDGYRPLATVIPNMVNVRVVCIDMVEPSFLRANHQRTIYVDPGTKVLMVTETDVPDEPVPV